MDITHTVTAVVDRNGIADGLLHVDALGATAAVMIQENWDASIQEEVIEFLSQQIPRGVLKHDAQNSNGDTHFKAGPPEPRIWS